MPVFVLLGLALPMDQWAQLSWVAVLVMAAAVVLRRLVTLWVLWPLLKGIHDRAEIAFLSWFWPIGISALFYATLAERETGDHRIFVVVTLAITCSVLIHGLSAAPLSAWLKNREPEDKEREEVDA